MSGSLKHMFRYRMSSVCFCVGMVVAFLPLYYGSRSELRLKNAMAETGENQYRYEVQATYHGDNLSGDRFPENGEGNCIIHNLYLLFDDVQIIHGVRIVVYANEDMHLPLISGTFPTEAELAGEELLVMLGVKYRDYVYRADGKEYFNIQGDSYLVKGYIGGGKSNEYDEYVLMFADNLGDKSEEQIASYSTGIELLFQSDSSDMRQIASETVEAFEGDGELFISSYEPSEPYVVAEADSTFFWIYAYCGGIVILISVFWIMQRKKELMIRKAYGYSNKRLVFFLAVEAGRLCTFSVFIVALIIMLVNGFSGAYMNDLSDELLLLLGTIIVYLLSIVALIMMYPIFCVVTKFSGAEINKKEI